MSSLEVYWSLSIQILGQLADVPPGTKIKGVSIS
jgi:hypothetical protein